MHRSAADARRRAPADLRQPVRRERRRAASSSSPSSPCSSWRKLGAIEAVQEETLGPILIVLAVDDVRDVTIDLLDEYEGTRRRAPAPAADE